MWICNNFRIKRKINEWNKHRIIVTEFWSLRVIYVDSYSFCTRGSQGEKWPVH